LDRISMLPVHNAGCEFPKNWDPRIGLLSSPKGGLSHLHLPGRMAQALVFPRFGPLSGPSQSVGPVGAACAAGHCRTETRSLGRSAPRWESAGGRASWLRRGGRGLSSPGAGRRAGGCQCGSAPVRTVTVTVTGHRSARSLRSLPLSEAEVRSGQVYYSRGQNLRP
jgi:hypothetical protein